VKETDNAEQGSDSETPPQVVVDEREMEFKHETTATSMDEYRSDVEVDFGEKTCGQIRGEVCETEKNGLENDDSCLLFTTDKSRLYDSSDDIIVLVEDLVCLDRQQKEEREPFQPTIRVETCPRADSVREEQGVYPTLSATDETPSPSLEGLAQKGLESSQDLGAGAADVLSELAHYQKDRCSTASSDGDNLTESIMSSILHATETLDSGSDRSVKTEVLNAERPLLETDDNVQCTCGSNHRRYPPDTNTKRTKSLSGEKYYTSQSIHPQSDTSFQSYRTINPFRKNKYKPIEPSNGINSRASLRVNAVNPPRSHRGSFAEAAAPSSSLKRGQISAADIHSGLDELDLLVYNIDPSSFQKNTSSPSTNVTPITIDLPVAEQLSVIAEEPEDVSTRSLSKSALPLMVCAPSLSKAKKLAQYMKRDAEASSVYIGAMYADCTSETEQSDAEHSGHISIEDAERSGFAPMTMQPKRRDDAVGPDHSAEPNVGKPTKCKNEVPKKEVLDGDARAISNSRNLLFDGDEILIKLSCENSSGQTSDITDMDFLKMAESSSLFNQTVDAVSDDDIDDENIFQTPYKPILGSRPHTLPSETEEEGDGYKDLSHVVSIQL
jgi:hypothetical protein